MNESPRGSSIRLETSTYPKYSKKRRKEYGVESYFRLDIGCRIIVRINFDRKVIGIKKCVSIGAGTDGQMCANWKDLNTWLQMGKSLYEIIAPIA